MANDPESAERLRAASDPATPGATLADLAYDYPALRAVVAGNPSTYVGLLDWLAELHDPDVDVAIAARSGAPTDVAPEPKDTPVAAPQVDSDAATADQPVQDAAVCAHCGEALRPATVFCGECGSRAPGRGRSAADVIRALRMHPAFLFAAIAAALVFVVLGGSIAAAATLTSARQAADDQANSNLDNDGGGSDSNAGSGGDPGTGVGRVSGESSIVPDCPAGLTPVSFSTWDTGDGATLVCQGTGQEVTVVMVLGTRTYTSASATGTPTGYHATFGNNLSVTIGLGGWATWVRDGGKTTLHAASSGWQTGDVETRTYPALTNKVEACPSGTYPLSLSTWNGGWLLTCGVNASTTTRFSYVDGSAHGSGHAMTTQGGQSCGTASAGLQVCVSANPAVVTFAPNGGSQTQHSVDSNYVVGEGFSGAGQGTGAYGLADPAASAASEVAYLNGILQQSQSARSSVKGVVQDILRCTSVQADVQTAQAVVDDRTTELQALNSAPVDAVPGGSALLQQLQAVLQDSLTADQAYVTAADQVASGQCPDGQATYNGQKPLIAQITSEKTTFSNTWNSQIASAYGTPTYTQDDI